jgi:uncharacterized membrane protein
MKTRLGEQGFSSKMILAILVAVILGVTGTAGCAMSQTREKFTEFYILGSEGKATDYPDELKVGEEGTVTVVIINREQETVNYWLEVRIDGVIDNERGPIELVHDQKWEEITGFTPDRDGDNQQVEFLLYKNGQNESYLGLHLWIDVEEGP